MDEFKAIPIKHVASAVSFPLSYIINRTLDTVIFPDPLKFGKVTPVSKGGNDQGLGT